VKNIFYGTDIFGIKERNEFLIARVTLTF